MLRIVALTVALWMLAFDADAAPLHHELTVSLDPVKRRLDVTDRIVVGAADRAALRWAERFRPQQVLLDGRAVAAESTIAGGERVWRVDVRAPVDRAAVLEVRYAGEIDALDPALDHRQVLELARPVAGAEGAFLPAHAGWYPQAGRESLTYRMKVLVPEGFRPVAPGRLLAESATAGGFEAVFETQAPLPGIDLMAGPYAVAEAIVQLAEQREVRVRTYFHAELKALEASYLESAGNYLRRYDASIGPYAFPSYSIVSSPLPTGFGMPGIAYLGRQVLRLPFIRATSLGHEVLHDWWGNGVFPDDARGNWSEGLTTFLADYAYKEDEGEPQARAMRLAWLRDFAAVRPEQDRALSAFVSRRHGADQAVGYHKAAFVFFMLRDLIGEGHFQAGMRRFWTEQRFRVASWDDLRRAFETAAGRDLRSFFTQWISRPGAPGLQIASARRAAAAGGHRLIVEIRQSGAAYALDVPLRVHMENGADFDTRARTGEAHTRLVLDLPARAQSLTLDPDVRIFRRLERQELAPIIREVMLDRRAALVVAGNDAIAAQSARKLAGALLEHAPALWDGASMQGAPPLLIVGVHADVAAFLSRHALPALPETLKARATALAYARRRGDGTPYVVVSARDAEALEALARALPHLGAQSYVAFEGARPTERGVWPAELRRYVIPDD